MAGDPYWSDVVFASHFDATNLACVKTGNLPSAQGANSVRSSTQSKFGGYSLYLPNQTNAVVTYANDAPNLVFDDADWSIEFWIYTTRSTARILRIPGVVVAIDSSQLRLTLSDPDFNQQVISGAGTITNEGWKHVAVERWGSAAYAYLDGVLGGSVSIGTMTLNTANSLSMNYDSTARVGGYVDDLLITSRARRKGAFTPPIEAFAEFYDPPASLIYWD